MLQGARAIPQEAEGRPPRGAGGGTRFAGCREVGVVDGEVRRGRRGGGLGDGCVGDKGRGGARDGGARANQNRGGRGAWAAAWHCAREGECDR